MKKLIEEGKLGRKTSGGLYKAETLENGKKRLLVYDIETGDYREKKKFEFPFAEEMKKQLKNGNYKEALSALIESDSKEADICLATGHPDEVCLLGMTPTTSTTVMTVIGDILVVETMRKTQFTIEEYSKRHHGGYLGERSRELSK